MKGWIGKRCDRRVCERLIEAKWVIKEGTSVNDRFRIFKDVWITVVAEVIGYRVCKDRKRGNAY